MGTQIFQNQIMNSQKSLWICLQIPASWPAFLFPLKWSVQEAGKPTATGSRLTRSPHVSILMRGAQSSSAAILTECFENHRQKFHKHIYEYLLSSLCQIRRSGSSVSAMAANIQAKSSSLNNSQHPKQHVSDSQVHNSFGTCSLYLPHCQHPIPCFIKFWHVEHTKDTI